MLRLTKSAENILTRTPISSVRANPVTTGVPVLEPNHQRIRHVMMVETLLSLMAGQARRKPASMAEVRVRPVLISSFIRSKISMLASTSDTDGQDETGHARQGDGDGY